MAAGGMLYKYSLTGYMALRGLCEFISSVFLQRDDPRASCDLGQGEWNAPLKSNVIATCQDRSSGFAANMNPTIKNRFERVDLPFIIRRHR